MPPEAEGMSESISDMSGNLSPTLSDEDGGVMLDDTLECSLGSPALPERTITPHDNSRETRTAHSLPTFANDQAIGSKSTSSAARSTSLERSKSPPLAHEQELAKGDYRPSGPPAFFIQYSVACRELAMQTQLIQPFDLVEPNPVVMQPHDPFEASRLRGVFRYRMRHPLTMPKKNTAPEWPMVKLAFGPLGWDQVWAYEIIDIRKILQNANNKSWWLARSEEPRIWCACPSAVEIHGFEVRFPYGHDATITEEIELFGKLTKVPKEVGITANLPVIIGIGNPITEWAQQVVFRNEYYDDEFISPPLPYPFNPKDPNQEPPTITVRFQNTHSERQRFIYGEPSYWRKAWMTVDELTILSGLETIDWLLAVVDGGHKVDPALSAKENKVNALKFWDLERLGDKAAKHLSKQRWVMERFGVDSRENQRILRQICLEKVRESVSRAVRSFEV